MIRIDDRHYSPAEVEALTAAHAERARLSDRPGARFAVCFANTIDWLGLFFAIRAAGGSLLPLHPSTPLDAARRLAREAGCHALYHNSLTAEEIAPLPDSGGCAPCPLPPREREGTHAQHGEGEGSARISGLTVPDPCSTLTRPLRGHPLPLSADLRSACRGSANEVCVRAGRERGSTPIPSGQLLQMSSGTTGAPKRIARSWAEIDREIESYVGFFSEPDGMTPVIACPTTHSYGLICGLLVGLRRGAEPVILDTTNPKFLLKALRQIEKPLLYSSPVILHTLARLMPEGERIHAAMTSGTLLPEPWFERIRSRTTHMFQQYGCSEAGCIAVNPDMAASAELGRVLPHHSLSTGTADAPAEIVLSGAGGEVRTRDLGYLREDGMLMFVSRLDDTINVAGLNVYPQEVEDVAMALPGVTDAVAFRRTDRFAGERVALLFSAAAEVTERALRDWCRENLAAHQQPGELIRADALPRMANGKISRREVAARYAEAAS